VIFAALEALSKIKVNKFRVAEAIENSPKESILISIVTHCTAQKKYCHCNVGKITEKKLI
jgi:hypothetical protein